MSAAVPLATSPLPSVEYLNECFSYDPVTGVLTWRERPEHHFHTSVAYPAKRAAASINAARAGKPITAMNKGYLVARLAPVGRQVTIHRIIWKMQTGQEPPEIDHKNQDRLDNRWANLRIATHSQNMCNMRRISRKRTDLPRGVSYDRARGRYMARLMFKGRITHFGRFDTVEEARAAYIKGARILHGEFYHDA